MSNEYINNEQINEQNIDLMPSRTLLSKITSSDNKNIALKKSRKLWWMTDYTLIADYLMLLLGLVIMRYRFLIVIRKKKNHLLLVNKENSMLKLKIMNDIF